MADDELLNDEFWVSVLSGWPRSNLAGVRRQAQSEPYPRQSLNPISASCVPHPNRRRIRADVPTAMRRFRCGAGGIIDRRGFQDAAADRGYQSARPFFGRPAVVTTR